MCIAAKMFGSLLHEITHFMDVDGFMVSKRFLCKELAITTINGYSYQTDFLLGKRFKQLSPQDQKTVRYVYINVHGIPFKDFHTEQYTQSKLDLAINIMIGDTINPVVAYKGGHLEKDILERAGIPCVNLEGLGCPKFSELAETYGNSVLKNSCYLHKRKYDRKRKRLHCCSTEVQLFRNWYIDYLIDNNVSPRVLRPWEIRY